MSLHAHFPFSLYLVISEQACRLPWLDVAEQAIHGGVDIIQLREKNCSSAHFLEKAYQLKELTDRYQIPLIINDDLQVAMQVDTAGIHVGNTDLSVECIEATWQKPEKLIGCSLEYPDLPSLSKFSRASYLGVSPIFPSYTKLDTRAAWGIPGLRNIRADTAKPLVSIGGIQLGDIEKLLMAGTNAIAVVSAICSAEDPFRASYLLKERILRNQSSKQAYENV